jgi:peptidyl-tRNA hydrolase
VLGAFEESEADAVGEMLASAANQAESWLSEGVQKAMNNFNGSVIPPTEQNEETEEKE